MRFVPLYISGTPEDTPGPLTKTLSYIDACLCKRAIAVWITLIKSSVFHLFHPEESKDLDQDIPFGNVGWLTLNPDTAQLELFSLYNSKHFLKNILVQQL